MSDTIVISEENRVVEVDETNVSVVSVGTLGPSGPPGTSGDKHYEQTFNTVSSVTVTHNLDKLPTVAVVDTSNDVVTGEIQYIDANTLRVLFSAPFSGVIICN